jgi:hypothetical protein
MLMHKILNFSRPHFKTRRVNHAFESIDHKKIAVLVHPSKITGTQESLTVEFNEYRGAVLRLVPITEHHLGPVNDNFL